jgi:hypothetical protein
MRRLKEENAMGMIFKVPAIIIYIVAGPLGFFMSLEIFINELHLGYTGGLIAFMFFPATLTFAPWYAAIAQENWVPMILVYGCGTVASILYAIGAAIDKD